MRIQNSLAESKIFVRDGRRKHYLTRGLICSNARTRVLCRNVLSKQEPLEQAATSPKTTQFDSDTAAPSGSKPMPK